MLFRGTVILSALACGLFPGAAARAGDWPQWGGTNARNMASAETGLPETFDCGEKDAQSGGVRMEATRHVRWAVRLGAMTCSTPAVDGDRVYFVNQRLELMCLSVTGGPRAAGPAPLKDASEAAKTRWPPAAGEAEVLWTFDIYNLGVRPSDACNGSPVVDDKFVYVLTGNAVGRGDSR